MRCVNIAFTNDSVAGASAAVNTTIIMLRVIFCYWNSLYICCVHLCVSNLCCLFLLFVLLIYWTLPELFYINQDRSIPVVVLAVFWGGREGFQTLLNTKVYSERSHMASFFRMAVGKLLLFLLFSTGFNRQRVWGWWKTLWAFSITKTLFVITVFAWLLWHWCCLECCCLRLFLMLSEQCFDAVGWATGRTSGQ